MKRLPLVSIALLVLSVPLEAREKWLELESPNFLMVTNASAGHARSALERMEQFRYILSQALPNQRFRTAVPTQVYGFRDFDTLEAFLPRSRNEAAAPTGYFRQGRFKNVIALDLGAERNKWENVLFHEYVHLVLSLNDYDYPLWFEEGMAELYAGVRFEKNLAELGVAREKYRPVLLYAELAPLEDLLTATKDSPLYSDSDRSPLFYAQSWALVHYLVAGNGLEGRERLARLLALLAEGENVLDAFPSAFGKDTDAFEEELGIYVRRGEFPSYRFPLAGIDREQPTTSRPLSSAEVQHRWGELFLYTGRAREAQVCLEEARRLDPDLGAVYETLGLAHLIAEQPEEARRDLQRAVNRGSASSVGLNQYARLLLQDYSGPGVKEIPEEIAREVAAAARESLRRHPGQVEAVRSLGFVYLVRGERLDEALALVRTALEIEPGELDLLFLHGQLLAKRGDYERAREDLARVAREAKERQLGRAATEFLDRMDTLQRAPDRR